MLTFVRANIKCEDCLIRIMYFQYDDKIKTEEDIDNKISSEIPDKDKDLILYEAGPCNAGKACYVIGVCTKRFP